MRGSREVNNSSENPNKPFTRREFLKNLAKLATIGTALFCLPEVARLGRRVQNDGSSNNDGEQPDNQANNSNCKGPNNECIKLKDGLSSSYEVVEHYDDEGFLASVEYTQQNRVLRLDGLTYKFFEEVFRRDDIPLRIFDYLASFLNKKDTWQVILECPYPSQKGNSFNFEVERNAGGSVIKFPIVKFEGLEPEYSKKVMFWAILALIEALGTDHHNLDYGYARLVQEGLGFNIIYETEDGTKQIDAGILNEGFKVYLARNVALSIGFNTYYYDDIAKLFGTSVSDQRIKIADLFSELDDVFEFRPGILVRAYRFNRLDFWLENLNLTGENNIAKLKTLYELVQNYVNGSLTIDEFLKLIKASTV